MLFTIPIIPSILTNVCQCVCARAYTMNTNTNTNKEGWRHQVLLLGPGAAPPTCSTVLSVPASPGSSGGNSNGSNSDGPPPDPRLRIFIKPRYSRDAGAGPSYPGYLATADPMLLVAEATWGFELVLPENIEYAHILLAIIIYPRRSMRGVGGHTSPSLPHRAVWSQQCLPLSGVVKQARNLPHAC